ncbi:MAG: DUF1273 family protein [Clostridia bacterium]|nr:DUF1273 family protein [Clostridia bacterium]
MNRDATCCFTGHRRVPDGDLPALTAEIDILLRRLCERGVKNFICGGAVGFDTVAACRVAVAAKNDPGIRLILFLPCRDQTVMWKRARDVALYQRLKGLASDVFYVADFYRDGIMLERNRQMADASSLCVAYYDGRGAGGTAYTVRYAVKRGLEVVNLFDKIH